MNGPKAAALNVAADELEMNLRRESVLFGLFVIILLVKVDNSRQFQTWRSRKQKKLSPICSYIDRKKLMSNLLFKWFFVRNNCLS